MNLFLDEASGDNANDQRHDKLHDQGNSGVGIKSGDETNIDSSSDNKD